MPEECIDLRLEETFLDGEKLPENPEKIEIIEFISMRDEMLRLWDISDFPLDFRIREDESI
jgi:hypothetical protein